MSDSLQFMKECEIFKGLSDSLLSEIFRRGSIEIHGPGEYLFKEGDSGFDVYVVRTGVVEIRKSKQPEAPPAVVAYLSRGECLGEMALITGRPRSASARVPQGAEVLRIPAQVYELILDNNFFLRRLCELLAYRLETADKKLAATPAGKELRGDLQYFDVSTVIQTLINSGQSGIMFIETPEKLRAEVQFAEGKILYAKLGELQGEDAFYQIFQNDLSGEFVFRGETVDIGTIASPIGKSPMNLLLEAMRMKDELQLFLGRIEDFNKVFALVTDKLVWHDPESLEVAQQVWIKISQGLPLERILKEIPRCTFITLEVIHQMLERGLIE